MPDLISLTLFVGALSLSSPSAVPPDQMVARPITTAAAAAIVPPASRAAAAPPNAARRRDSLKNGAIIGAVAGGAIGVVAGTYGCALGGVLDAGSGNANCGAGIVLAAAAGALIGAFIGVGIDALFEQAPHPAPGAGGRWMGVRLNVRF